MKQYPRKRVLILGSYGCGNRGDDAILGSIVDYFPDCEITATCGRDTRLKSDIPIRYISCRLAEGKITFPILCNIALAMLRFFLSIPRMDVVIYGGGSSLHDLTPYNLPFWFLIQFWANLWRKRVYYVGMGLGPIDTPRGKSLCKYFLPRCDRVYVRDKRGYNICKELGIQNVSLVNDAAFSRHTVKPGTLSQEPYICVTASAWFRSSDWWREGEDFQQELEANYRHLASCLTALAEHSGKKLVFLPTFNHDGKIGRYLEANIPSGLCTCVPETLSFQEMSDIIGGAYALVGMRMHSMIFALRQNVPVIAIKYDEKINQLMQGIGIARYSLDLEELSAQTVTELYDQLEENRETVRQTIRSRVQDYAQATSDCMDQIRGSIQLPPYDTLEMKEEHDA